MSAVSDQGNIRRIKIIASGKIFSLRRHNAKTNGSWIREMMATLHGTVGGIGEGRDVL